MALWFAWRARAGGPGKGPAPGGTFAFYLWFLVSLPLDATVLCRLAAIEAVLAPIAVDVGAASLVLLVLLFCPRRLRIPLLWLLASVASIWTLGSLAYFRYFGEVVSLGAIRLAGQLPTVSASLFSLLFVQEVLLVLDLLPAGLAALLLTRQLRETDTDTKETETEPASALRTLLRRRSGGVLVLAFMVVPALISIVAANHSLLSQRFQNRLVV